jgi:hypothetical protein|tara:strand:+ start:197 stop:574 length:378 start_codon:yes stop_codon:yes gene_type:complete
MSSIELKLVTLDNLHELLPKYISENNIIIAGYDDIMDVVLRMIKGRYLFNMDKNILRGCLEDMAYMYCPGDDVNKDRVIAMLEPSDDEDDSDDEMEITDFLPEIQQIDNLVSDSDKEVDEGKKNC